MFLSQLRLLDVSNVFRRRDSEWSIAFECRCVLVKDMRGLRAIAYLLSRPGIESHVFELMATWTGTRNSCEARPKGPEAERARVNVTRAIKAAVDRIAEVHPALGVHLRGTVRTGTWCVYAPDPRLEVRWEM